MYKDGRGREDGYILGRILESGELYKEVRKDV